MKFPNFIIFLEEKTLHAIRASDVAFNLATFDLALTVNWATKLLNLQCFQIVQYHFVDAQVVHSLSRLRIRD